MGGWASRYWVADLVSSFKGLGKPAATVTNPEAQAPHALEFAACEGTLDDPCPALSALRQSTGHRPASTVTKSATSRTQTRISFVPTENLCADPTSDSERSERICVCWCAVAKRCRRPLLAAPPTSAVEKNRALVTHRTHHR